MTTRILVAIAAIVVSVSVPGPVVAQPAEADVAFQRGRTLMAHGEVAAACDAFETSMRLDASNGTLYNLALCHEKLGKLASAWSEFKRLAETDTNKRRAEDARQRAAALEPRLARMRVVLTSPAPGEVVLRNDVDVTALVGQEPPVDPGTYTFTAKAPDHDLVTLNVQITEGKTSVVSIPELRATIPPVVGYPTTLPRRPLILPDRMIEVSGSTALATNMSYAQDPLTGYASGRIALGPFELSAGFSLHFLYSVTKYKPDAINSLSATAKYAITPMFVGLVSFTSYQPTGPSGTGGSDFHATLARKLLLFPWLAVQGNAGLLFRQRDRGTNPADEFSFAGTGVVQAAATDALSFQLDTGLDINLGGALVSDTVELGVNLGAMYAITSRIDVFARFYAALLPTGDYRSYTVGGRWRTR